MDFYSFSKFERIDNAQIVEDSCPNSPTHIPFPPLQLLGLFSHGKESNSREKKGHEKMNLDFSEGFRSLRLHSGLWLVREQGILITGWLSLCFVKIKESIEDKEIIFTMKDDATNRRQATPLRPSYTTGTAASFGSISLGNLGITTFRTLLGQGVQAHAYKKTP